VGKRVHSTSLYHSRQCDVVLNPLSDNIVYTVVSLSRSTAAESCENKLFVRVECDLKQLKLVANQGKPHNRRVCVFAAVL